MDENLKAKIEFEISKIDSLVEKSSVLFEKCAATDNPDFIELNAAGSVLHSYYNGLESIFLLIYKRSGCKPLSGNKWHSELLSWVFSETESKTPILSADLFAPLKEYLGFRHIFRHSYGYELKWNLLKPMFSQMKDNWKSVKSELESFLEK